MTTTSPPQLHDPAQYRIRLGAIPAAHLGAVRRSGLDVSGRPVIVAEDPGAPLRCCLRDAREGEPLILFGYEPPIPGTGSPYREIGAVFAHAEPCGGPADESAYPSDWLGRPQVLRAYDERGWIHPATTTHDGADPLAAIGRILAEPGVVVVHSRNVAYGCFMFVATAPADVREA
jgi:hypothetical protein